MAGLPFGFSLSAPQTGMSFLMVPLFEGNHKGNHHFEGSP